MQVSVMSLEVMETRLVCVCVCVRERCRGCMCLQESITARLLSECVRVGGDGVGGVCRSMHECAARLCVCVCVYTRVCVQEHASAAC